MKIKRGEAVKICLKFIEQKLREETWYSKTARDIKAVLLYGSVAKGTNTENSDIDLMVILPLESEKKYTKGEYIYKYEGQEINIVLRSIEKLRSIDFIHDDFQREIFRGCEFIKESDSEVKNLITISNTML